jgi:hypothetical protein
MQHCDAETSLEIVLIYLFESSEDGWDGSIGEMIDSGEAYLATQCQKERYLVDKEDIRC